EDMALAGRVAAESLAIYEELGNRFGIADANWMRVRSPVWALTPGDGMPFAEELLAQARGLGDHRWGRALLMVSNGFRRVGRLDEAESMLLEAEAAADRAGAPIPRAIVARTLGHAHLSRGETDAAGAAFRRDLALCSEVGDRVGVWIALAGLGVALLAGGHEAEAREQLQQSLRVVGSELRSGVGRLTGVVCLRGLARIAATDDAERAARLLGAADTLEPDVATAPSMAPPAVDMAFVDALRARLPP